MRTWSDGSAIASGKAWSATALDPEDESFEAFFDAEWPRLFRALLLLTGNAHEAEDLTQGAFLKLLERWDALDHGADLQGYLFERL